MYKFTVCIPSYNRAHTIQKTLDSLVNQTLKDFEVLVVDDGSSDNTKDVVRPYELLLNLHYIYKTNGGKHTALNKGIENATGELFIILDSDDKLTSNCLENMYEKWKELENKEPYCGVMGKSIVNNKMLGSPFPTNLNTISYVEYHYGKYAGLFIDCCECLRTDILKQYSWPENLDTKFVPENFVMDQIGLKYKLLLTNDIYKEIVYENDGITNNKAEYTKSNICGYLFNAISKIELILPYAKETELTPHAGKYMWYYYWQLVQLDINKKGPRIRNVSLFGYVMLIRYKTSQIVKRIFK